MRERGGGPLAGAQVCVGSLSYGIASDDRSDPACVVTDAAGTYRVAGLVPGPQDLSGERRRAPAPRP